MGTPSSKPMSQPVPTLQPQRPASKATPTFDTSVSHSTFANFPSYLTQVQSKHLRVPRPATCNLYLFRLGDFGGPFTTEPCERTRPDDPIPSHTTQSYHRNQLPQGVMIPMVHPESLCRQGPLPEPMHDAAAVIPNCCRQPMARYQAATASAMSGQTLRRPGS